MKKVLVVAMLAIALLVAACAAPTVEPTKPPAPPAAPTTAPAAPTAAPAAPTSAPAAPTAAPAATSPAASLQSFYSGKVLDIVVPQKAGATSDTVARILAKYLTTKLGVKVMVENQDAASGLVARNDFFNSAKPDGLNLLLEPTGSNMGDWAMGSSGVNYDITKVNYLGGLPRGPLVITSSSKGPYKTIQDMINSKDQLKFASMTPGSLITLSNMAAAEILGLKATVITGYPGATERALAMTQGEVAGAVYNAEWAATQAKQGQLNLLLQVSAERDKNYPDTPCLSDVVKLTDYHRSLLAAIIPDGTMVVAPPGTPADRVQFLRDNLAAIFADKDFQAEIVKVLPPWLGIWSGDDVTNIANNIAKNKASFISAYADLTKKYVK